MFEILLKHRSIKQNVSSYCGMVGEERKMSRSVALLGKCDATY